MERTKEQLVDLGRDRCPYCHDEVSRESAVVCQSCLARHHVDCWDEAGRCSSCGALERLEPKGRPRLTKELARQTLSSAGFPQEEIAEVLEGAGGATREDPFRRPRPCPTEAPFRVTLSSEGVVELTWEHHATWAKWFMRVITFVLFPAAFLMPTVWSMRGGSLKLGPEKLEAVGLFRGVSAVGRPVSRTYARDLPLKIELAGFGRLTVSLYDGDTTLHVLGTEGLLRGLEAAHATWLVDLLLAWQRDELEAWRPHLG